MFGEYRTVKVSDFCGAFCFTVSILEMFEEYVSHGGRKLRCGYTTGSCAAAAAGAAAEMLLCGDVVGEFQLVTPKGIVLSLEILDPKIGEDFASCAVRKDGGDDIDATDGILVYAEVKKLPCGVKITGGEGVGKVTRAGLDRPVGDFAINSVPRKMIEESVLKAAEKSGYESGFSVRISVPNGEVIAKKTYNPRMGIEGGISIIGTTGIVEPMSRAALVDTIRAEAKMRRAAGGEGVVLMLGNYGESFISEKFPFLEKCSVKCSNFIGEALDIAVELGFSSVLLVGHLGKLTKLGAGIMNTHSREADGRMEVLAACGLKAGVSAEKLSKILDCVTVDAALALLSDGEREKTLEILSRRVEYYLNARVQGSIKTAAIMFSDKLKIIAKTELADGIVEEIERVNR